MTGLPAILYAVLLTAMGAGVLYLAYRGCVKVVDWREHDRTRSQLSFLQQESDRRTR